MPSAPKVPNPATELRQAFLLPLISHVEAAALVVEEQIVDAEHAHAQAHLGAQAD